MADHPGVVMDKTDLIINPNFKDICNSNFLVFIMLSKTLGMRNAALRGRRVTHRITLRKSLSFIG